MKHVGGYKEQPKKKKKKKKMKALHSAKAQQNRGCLRVFGFGVSCVSVVVVDEA